MPDWAPEFEVHRPWVEKLLREAWGAATERAAKVCEAERIDEIHEGDLIYNEAVDKCATAIRSSGRREG